MMKSGFVRPIAHGKNSCGHFTSLYLTPILFLPILLWGKLNNNTENIAAPWK